MCAGMNTTLHKATLTTALPPELHLNLYPTTGLVRCVAWTHQISQRHRMKKGIFFIISFFLLVSIFAQSNRWTSTNAEGAKQGRSNFHGGIKGGFTGSQITGDGFPFQGFNKFGGYAGLFVNFPVSRNGKWLLQTELNFIMKGCKHLQKFDEDGEPIGPVHEDYVLQLMYGQLPLLVKWRFFKGFELEVGPAFGILIKNADVEQVNGYLNVGAPRFARYEFSGIIGLGYLFFNHLGVNVRFEGSFLPVRKISRHHYTYLLAGQHNQTFAFSVYYQF
jgi:hypothetical protein